MKPLVLMPFLFLVAVAMAAEPRLDYRFVHPLLENATPLENKIRSLNTQLYTLLITSSVAGGYDRNIYCSDGSNQIRRLRLSPDTLRAAFLPELQRVKLEFQTQKTQYETALMDVFKNGSASFFLAEFYRNWLRIELRSYEETLNSLTSTVSDYTQGVNDCFLEPYYSVPLVIAVYEFEQNVPQLLTGIAQLDQLFGSFLKQESPWNQSKEQTEQAFAHMDAEFRRVIADVKAARAELLQVYDAELAQLKRNDVMTLQELNKIQKMNAGRFLDVLDFTSTHLSQIIDQFK